MKRIAGIIIFLIAAIGLYIYSQTQGEISTEISVIDPLTVEQNYTPSIIPEAVIIKAVNPPFDDATAYEAIKQAESAVQRLKLKGLPTDYARDTILEVRKAYEGQNVTEIIAEILQIKDAKHREKTLQVLNLTPNMTKVNMNYTRTIELATQTIMHAQALSVIQERITLLNLTLQQMNRAVYNLTEIDDKFSAIADRMNKEQDVETIGDEITKTYKRFDAVLLEQSRTRVLLAASQRTIKNFIIINWKTLIITLVILIIITIIATNEIRLYETENKIHDSKIEHETLQELIKKTQTERYVEKKISIYEYKIRLGQFKNRITTIEHTLPVLTARKERLEKYRRYYAFGR